MRKLIGFLLAISMLVLTSCSIFGGKTPPIEESLSESSKESEISDDGSQGESEGEGEEIKLYSDYIKEKMDLLTKDAYKDLEVDAAVLERKALLPGSIIPITISITNNGDKTITYPVGSGGNVVPDALSVIVDGMQYVSPKEHLGPMTTDMQYDELKPGESLEFKVNVMAVSESANFDEYVLEYFVEKEEYIGEVDTTDFLSTYSDLKKMPSGQYKATVYFIYSVKEDGVETMFDDTKASYNTAEFDIGLSD